MKKLVFKHHPMEYYSGTDFFSEKQMDEQSLLDVFTTTEDICISVVSDFGSTDRTVYKCQLKDMNHKPASIDDFLFEIIKL